MKSSVCPLFSSKKILSPKNNQQKNKIKETLCGSAMFPLSILFLQQHFKRKNSQSAFSGSFWVKIVYLKIYM